MSVAFMVPVVADGWHMDGNWWFGGMMLWMALLWTAIAVGVVWLVRATAGRRRDDVDDAMAILDRRLAEGEMTLDEYRERKAAIAER